MLCHVASQLLVLGTEVSTWRCSLRAHMLSVVVLYLVQYIIIVLVPSTSMANPGAPQVFCAKTR